MGLFSRKNREPMLHPEVRRAIVVPARIDTVITQLEAYGALHSPRHATSHRVFAGERDGWTVVELPLVMHPWTFHNVGFWLLDTPGAGEGTVLRSGPSPEHSAYALVRDPQLDDCLCGVDERGEGWTVSVPTNEIVRPETVPATAPPATPTATTGAQPVEILMEDPGHDMNPTNAPTAATRRRLATMVDVGQYSF